MACTCGPTPPRSPCSRAASLIEHYVVRPQDDATQIDGNIYLGRVQNVLPGMEAAFVDIGTPKNAVLYRGDVRYDADDVEGERRPGGPPAQRRPHRAAAQARPDHPVPGHQEPDRRTRAPASPRRCRSPAGSWSSSPTATPTASPSASPTTSASGCARILDDVKPDEHGLIVRTAAEGATADELRRDVALLLDAVGADRRQGQAGAGARPALPGARPRRPGHPRGVQQGVPRRRHRRSGALRGGAGLRRAASAPSWPTGSSSTTPTPSACPLFERLHVHEQLHKALDRKVWLPSGGSLIIERTEALTVIDVNTGKNVGTSNLEETVYPQQPRGGRRDRPPAPAAGHRRDHRHRLHRHGDPPATETRSCASFRAALARDKTRTQVFDISELGLVEMTRKRISEGLVESFSPTCPTCDGRGLIMDDTLL